MLFNNGGFEGVGRGIRVDRLRMKGECKRHHLVSLKIYLNHMHCISFFLFPHRVSSVGLSTEFSYTHTQMWQTNTEILLLKRMVQSMPHGRFNNGIIIVGLSSRTKHNPNPPIKFHGFTFLLVPFSSNCNTTSWFVYSIHIPYPLPTRGAGVVHNLHQHSIKT